MKKRLFMALALAFAPATAALAQDAHGDNAEVVSVPADDAVLTRAPSAISLTFEHAVVLTQVEVHAAGEVVVPISFTAASAAATTHSIPLPALASGAYEIHWSATGDGHAMAGTLHFTVQ